MSSQHIPPLLPEHYIARPDAEAQLRDHLLSDDHTPLTILYGESGTGKSTLATRVLQSLDIEKRFPGGVFWINHPEPMLSDYLWKQLCALNPLWEKRPRLAAGDLHKELWHELDLCCALFILDNVTEARQIHELLFGSMLLRQERMHTVVRSRLIRVLDETLNDNELQDFCLELDIDYESLSAVGKKFKIRELIDYCYRHNRISQLIVHHQNIHSPLTLYDLLPGRSRILALSKSNIANLPLPSYMQVIATFCEQEALALFERYLDQDLYNQNYEILCKVASHLKYNPQAIDTHARAFRSGELSPDTFLQSCARGKDLPVSEHTFSQIPAKDAAGNYHQINIHIAIEDLRDLWQKAQSK